MARRRRLFAATLALLGLCSALLLHLGALAQPAAGSPATPAAAAPATPQVELRGVWLTANDMPVLRDRERMRETVGRLAALGFNTVYPVVWNGGMAYYPSAVVEQRQLQDFRYLGLQGQDVLGELIAEGRRQRLLVIPWFEFGFMAPLHSTLAKRHRDWLTQEQDGGLTSMSAAGEVAWLNPFRPEVQQLITDLVLEVVGTYGADGIQFDDHMTLPREFGYDPFTIALYRRETGKNPPANPADAAWVKWRADKITAFMDRLSKAVRQRRPGAIVSVSPNYYDFAYKLQLQDWLTWVRRGIADELLVQIYRDDMPSYSPHLRRPEVQEASRRIPTAIAILSGQRSRPTPMQLIQQKVLDNRQAGLGVSFFYLESLWGLGPEPPDLRQSALARLFAVPAPRLPVATQAASPQVLPQPSSLPPSGPLTAPPPAPPALPSPPPVPRLPQTLPGV